MPNAVLTSKGQVTIPKQVRDRLRLHQGDKVEFVMNRDGSVQLRPLGRSVRELAGLLHRPDLKASTVEEMDEAVKEHLSREDERIRSGR